MAEQLEVKDSVFEVTHLVKGPSLSLSGSDRVCWGLMRQHGLCLKVSGKGLGDKLQTSSTSKGTFRRTRLQHGPDHMDSHAPGGGA